MLVLLPPSEGKARPEMGGPIDLGSLAFAEQLDEQREQLLGVLDPQLCEAPTAPAAEVYTGVLYQERRRTQSGLAHGQGSTRRRRAGAAGGEESAR